MRRIDFAELCGVGPSMVTKYADAGLLVFSDSKTIDVAASLQQLDGTLDEDKRRAALVKFAEMAPQPTLRPVNPRPRPAKGDLDDIRRDIAALDLAERAKLLMPTAEVERMAYDAVFAMRQVLEASRRETAEQLCRDFAAAPERAAAANRTLQKAYAKALGEFSAKMQVAAEEEAVEDAHDQLAPALESAAG